MIRSALLFIYLFNYKKIPPLLSWEPSSNYSFFWGRTLREGVRGRLGTFAPGEPVSGRVSNIDRPAAALPEWLHRCSTASKTQ